MTGSSSRKALGNATALLAGAAAETALQLVFLVIVSRRLGPAEFGFYGYLLAMITFAAAVAHFGLPVVAVREIAQRPFAENQIFASTFRIRAIFSLLFFCLAIAAALFMPLMPLHRTAMVLMFAYLLFVPFDLSFLFDAHQQSRWDVPGKVAGRLLSVGLLILLWRTKGTVTVADAALCSTLLMAVNALVGWRVARRRALPLKFFAATDECRTLIRQSLPVMWSGVMTLAYSQSQTILVKWLSTAVETGYNALASRLFLPVLIFRGIIYRVLLPLISESAQDHAAFTARLERIFPALGLLFMPAAALAIPAAEILIVPLFGAEYAGAVLPFQITIGHLFLTGFGAMFGTALLASGDARTPAVGLTLGCVCSLALSVALIPSYGAVGAAWGTVLGEVVSLTYALSKFVRVLHPVVLPRLLKIAASALGGILAYYALKHALPGSVAFAAAIIVILAALGLAGEITRDRLQTVFGLFRRSSDSPINLP